MHRHLSTYMATTHVTSILRGLSGWGKGKARGLYGWQLDQVVGEGHMLYNIKQCIYICCEENVVRSEMTFTTLAQWIHLEPIKLWCNDRKCNNVSLVTKILGVIACALLMPSVSRHWWLRRTRGRSNTTEAASIRADKYNAPQTLHTEMGTATLPQMCLDEEITARRWCALYVPSCKVSTS